MELEFLRPSITFRADSGKVMTTGSCVWVCQDRSYLRCALPVLLLLDISPTRDPPAVFPLPITCELASATRMSHMHAFVAFFCLVVRKFANSKSQGFCGSPACIGVHLLSSQQGWRSVLPLKTEDSADVRASRTLNDLQSTLR